MKRLCGSFALLIVLSYSTELEAQVQNTLWGTALEGGASGIGAIYMTNADGTGIVVPKSFNALPGRYPTSRLVQTASGKLYGMTGVGGSYRKGVIFEYDLTTGNYQAVIHFDGAAKGSYPYGSLASGGNGKLYGMTRDGGSSNKGVLFEFDPANGNFVKKFDFDGTTNGGSPTGDLALAGSGLMYGVTYSGGSNSAGVLFSFNPATGAFTKNLDLSVATGSRPQGGLLVTATGLLLGMASEGGLGAKGTLYEYDPVGNAIIKRVDFTGANGALPLSHLMQASNGLIYGMTVNGGSTDQGVLFEYDAATFALTKMIDFNGGTRGILPAGGLMQASNGKIYGATEQGLTGYGGIFEYDIDHVTLVNVVTFSGARAGIGASPRSTLMQAANGKLYGVTTSGGNATQGVLFELDPITKASLAKVHFQKPEDGDFPAAPLVQHSNGRLYGVTYMGGIESSGVLFEFDMGLGVYTKKKDLTYSGTGIVPSAALCLATNGMLYGVTPVGGSSTGGTLFRYDVATNNLTVLFNFSPSATGQPSGGLIQAANGKLYGVTSSGGANNKGVVYEYDLVTGFLIRASFDGINNGTAAASLVEVGSKLYGLAQNGGASDKGTLYEFNPATGTITKKVDFTGPNGMWPIGALVAAPNGSLFGVTRIGGTFDWGTIFEFNTTNGVFNTRYSFTGTLSDGVDLPAGLSLSSNGKFYGVTEQGGVDNSGVFYEFDPATYAYAKKIDFIGPNGARPANAPILVSMQSQTITFDPLASKTFGDPNFALSASTTSGLGITFESSNPLVATISGNTVTLVGAGTTTIKAVQNGSKAYFSAAVDQLLTVAKKDQTISFPEIPTRQINVAPFALSVTTSSGLPVTFTSSDPAVATISGMTVTLVSPGTTTIEATQSGNTNYLPVTASRLLTVTLVTGVEPYSQSKTLAYPNPANEEIFIELPSGLTSDHQWIDVVSATGRTTRLQLDFIEGNTYRGDLRQISSGMYLIFNSSLELKKERLMIIHE